MPSIKRYPIQRVINWYFGNFCTRKCFNKDERLMNCYKKFELLKSQNKDLLITHKEFKDLIDSGDIKICRLNPNFRRKTIGWKEFEGYTRNLDFDPDKFD
ncbi:MAG: hypothetical protein KAT43_05140 [Nanoarchaeota archaeon]|nr:hypothetical protein [Nanoarchaeota archaeon]